MQGHKNSCEITTKGGKIMCDQNTSSDLITGRDLYNIALRSRYESIMEPFIYKHCNVGNNLKLTLQPHIYLSTLGICFYSFPRSITLFVPIDSAYTISEMLNYIYTQYKSRLPTLQNYISSSPSLSGLDEIRQKFNKK